MSDAAPQRLLLDALLLPAPQAGNAWRSWRDAADLDHLDAASFHFLPALAGRMAEWLANDPRQAILLGICRRAWSQNQIRRKLLADALEILNKAGIERAAATGPLLWGALYWPDGAIRSIGRVDVLVEPALLPLAIEALSKAGWTAPYGIPAPATPQFDSARGVLLQSPSGGEMRLHWRGLPNAYFFRRPQFPPLEALRPGQVSPYAMTAEHALIAVLGGEYQDEIDWHCDALMISRHAGLDWKKAADLLRWRSTLRTKLEEVRRDWGAEIPPAVTRPVLTRRLERLVISWLRG